MLMPSTNTVKTVLEFPHNYEVDAVADLPSSGQRIVRYHDRRTDGGKEGVIARISPSEDDQWYAIFEFGCPNDYGESNGAYSTPDPMRLCVVANGDAYVVHTADPNKWTFVPSRPVVDVRIAVLAKVLLFADFTEIVAYGSNGICWTTEDLACDGFSINAIEANTLRGRTDACPCHGTYEFSVDLATGKHTGLRRAYEPPLFTRKIRPTKKHSQQ
jgi:hypothetical protein